MVAHADSSRPSSCPATAMCSRIRTHSHFSYMPLTVLWQKPARARPVVRAWDGARQAKGARAFVDVGVARQVALGVPRVALDMAALVVPVRRPVIRQLAPVAGFELAGVRAVPGTQVGVPRSVAAPLLVDGSLFDGSLRGRVLSGRVRREQHPGVERECAHCGSAGARRGSARRYARAYLYCRQAIPKYHARRKFFLRGEN